MTLLMTITYVKINVPKDFSYLKANKYARKKKSALHLVIMANVWLHVQISNMYMIEKEINHSKGAKIIVNISITKAKTIIDVLNNVQRV